MATSATGRLCCKSPKLPSDKFLATRIESNRANSGKTPQTIARAQTIVTPIARPRALLCTALGQSPLPLGSQTLEGITLAGYGLTLAIAQEARPDLFQLLLDRLDRSLCAGDIAVASGRTGNPDTTDGLGADLMGRPPGSPSASLIIASPGRSLSVAMRLANSIVEMR